MFFVRKLQFLIVLAVVCVFTFSFSADAKLTHEDAYAVWKEVAEAAGLTDLPFDIEEEEQPNAWVANGESVTATTGLLNILETRAELYGILAHEAGHANLNHYGNTVNKETGLAIGTFILNGVLGSDLADAVVRVGSGLVKAGWSREQEVAADDYAVALAYENGGDIVGLYSAMLRVSTFSGKLEPNGLNSHPPDERRLFHIKNEILKYDPTATFPEPPETDA